MTQIGKGLGRESSPTIRQTLPNERETSASARQTSSIADAPRIVDILVVPAVGAGYYEDQAALQAEHVPLPERFSAPPITPGFRAVREVAEAVSVGLVLDTGQVAWGDCVAVSYSAKAGRDSVFRTAAGLDTLQQVAGPFLRGRSLTSFRGLAAEIDALRHEVVITRPMPQPKSETRETVSRRDLFTAPLRAVQAAREAGAVDRVVEERPLHVAVRYGLSQALLGAVALARGVTMAQVVADEWGLPPPDAPVPIHAQSGSERYYNAQKMIARRIASLPHALVDNVPDQVGTEGAELTRYIRWLARTIDSQGDESYRPAIHLDLHGALGQIYNNEPGHMLGQLFAWELAAEPYLLRIESPMVLESREAQIAAMHTLRDYARLRKMKVQLVADEWANTLDDICAFVDAGAANMIQVKMPDLGGIHNSIEAVLACQAGGVRVLLGGSYTETDLSARISAHVALATRPDLVMAKPGLGVDEGISLVQNEMARTLACIGRI
jgi:methylaspartate ammonia-lyase